MATRLTEDLKIVGCLAPIDGAAGAKVGKPIDLALYDGVTFLVYIGARDSTGLITVEKGTASTLGTAIAYNYQFASAGTAAFSVLDGAVTAATVTGLAMGTSPVTNGILAITVSKADIGAGYNWVGVKIAASGTANLMTIVALVRGPFQKAAIPADPTT